MKSVLILDDDEDLRALLRLALEQHDIVVSEAECSARANAIFNERPIDLAIVDGALQGESGIDFIENLRQRDAITGIVFVSAHFRDLKTLRHLTEDLHVSSVAYKPLDPNEFTIRIVELLSVQGCNRRHSPVDADLAAIETLRHQFTERLSQKVAELQKAVLGARDQPDRVLEARSLAHKLRGSAGSYGHPAVSEGAGVLEDLLQNAITSGLETSSLWGRLNHALQDVVAAAKLETKSEKRRPADTESTARNVLVVADDTELLQIVRVVTRRWPIQTLVAHTPEQALWLAQHHSFGAAVFDGHFGNEQLGELVRALSEAQSNRSVAIAFVSSDHRIETRVAALQAGANKFLHKPVSEGALNELFLQVLRESERRTGHILIVDDDADVIAEYSRYLLAAHFTVEALSSAEGLVARLEESNVDVVLLDIDLPRISGIDVCRALRMSEHWEMLPILIVSAHVDAATRLRAFKAGASDVIAKPVLPEELLARVTVQEERMRLLHDRAQIDSLSGLLLRRALLDAFQRVIAICARDGRPVSIVLFDIDHFKQINDAYGHLAGDRVISALGELMRRRFRVEDLRGRWGGEEFLLVLPGAKRQFARELAENLLADFSALEFSSDDNRPFRVTFTGGVAQYPEDGTSIVTLIRFADERLYAGKHGGRNRIVCDDHDKLQEKTP